MSAAAGYQGVARGADRFQRRDERRRFLRLMAAAVLAAVGGDSVFETNRTAWAAGPIAGRHPLGPGLNLRVSAEDRCPVCGMRPFRYPEFSCAIRLRDGRTFYFCSAGCMLRAWVHPDVHLSVPAAERELAVVREYLSGEAMDARAVAWVAGSDVIGPMGPAFVGLAGERHLAAFRRRHGGKHVFRLDDLSDDLWRTITGKPAAP